MLKNAYLNKGTKKIKEKGIGKKIGARNANSNLIVPSKRHSCGIKFITDSS